MPGRRKKKRPNGEGSITLRGDGRYQGRYTVQTPGGPKRRSVYGKTRADVAAKLAKAIAEREARFFDALARDAKLGEYLEAYLADAAGRVRPKTQRRYEDLARLHLLPALGGRKLGAITPAHLRALYADRLEAGLAPRSVVHVHTLLKQVLKQAVADGLILRNAADAVRPPRSATKEIRPLTAGQVRVLFDACQGHRYEALYVLAVTAGLRRGELLGLRWEDVSFGHGRLVVRRTLQQGQLLAPKTATSRRSITLPKRALGSLEDHRDRQAMERAGSNGSWTENDLVFPNKLGNFTCGDNLCSRSFKPLLKRTGLPNIRFHDLRHTCATLLLVEGVHPKYVQALLGHANVGLTLDLYSHWMPSMSDAAAGAMDNALE